MNVSMMACSPTIRTVSASRLRRSFVYHRAAFDSLVEVALEGLAYLRHSGAYWSPVVATRGFGIYRRAPDMLACVQDQIEDYEALVYASLLRGACGRDGILRPRTRLWRKGDGTFGASLTPVGGSDG